MRGRIGRRGGSFGERISELRRVPDAVGSLAPLRLLSALHALRTSESGGFSIDLVMGKVYMDFKAVNNLCT